VYVFSKVNPKTVESKENALSKQGKFYAALKGCFDLGNM